MTHEQDRQALARLLPAILADIDDAGSAPDDWEGSEYVARLAARLIAAGVTPPGRADADTDRAGSEAGLNHLPVTGGPKSDSDASARTTAKGMSVGQPPGRADAEWLREALGEIKRFAEANTKRGRAVSAAILDACAAQIQAEAEHGCMPEHQGVALSIYARGIRNVAESLFIDSQPSRKAGGGEERR